MGKILVSQTGYDQQVAEINEIEHRLAALIMQRGEFEVNTSSNYKSGTSFEDEIRGLQYALALAKDRLKDLEIISREHSTDGRVGLDDIVEVYLFENNQIMRVQLTGEKPDIAKSKISLESPMGKAIFVKKFDDIVSYVVSGRMGRKCDDQKITIKILSVERAQEKESDNQNQPGVEEE